MHGEELERSLDGLVRLCATYPFRGLKGAVGTRLDQITLLGDIEKAEQLDDLLLAAPWFAGFPADRWAKSIPGVSISKPYHFSSGLLPGLPVLQRPSASQRGMS